MTNRSTVRQCREAARILEFLSHGGRQSRRPVSLEEYEALLRAATKDGRAKRQKQKHSASDLANRNGRD